MPHNDCQLLCVDRWVYIWASHRKQYIKISWRGYDLVVRNWFEDLGRNYWFGLFWEKRASRVAPPLCFVGCFSSQPTLFFSHTKPVSAISQPAVIFSHNKPAPATSRSQQNKRTSSPFSSSSSPSSFFLPKMERGFRGIHWSWELVRGWLEPLFAVLDSQLRVGSSTSLKKSMLCELIGTGRHYIVICLWLESVSIVVHVCICQSFVLVGRPYISLAE